MKTKIIILILIIFSLNNVIAQSRKDSNKGPQAYFMVQPNEELLKDSLYLKFQKNQWDLVSGIPYEIVSGQPGKELKISFKSGESFLIANLVSGENRDLFVKGVIEPTDSIIFRLLKDSVEIAGRGKEKYQLAQELEKKITTMERMHRDSLLKSNQDILNLPYENIERMAFWLAKVPEIKQKKRKIILEALEKYKPKLSNIAYKVMKMNWLEGVSEEYLKQFNTDLNYLKTYKSEDYNSSYHRLEKIYSANQLGQTNNPEKDMAISGGSIRYILEQIKNRKYNPKTQASYNAQSATDYIIETYSGLLRDRLLTIFLIRTKINSDELPDLISKSLNVIKTDYCRKLLQNLKGNSSPGSKAFEFALRDTTGNIIKQSDFKGKVVLLDFYFTYCGACKIVNERMKPIFEQFKENPKMKFVSINVDKDKELWKKSVISLEYSHEGSINLNTNGEGTNAEIIKHYNITGYPKLILIDKEGRIISVEPPRPWYIDGKEQIELTKMINEALLAK